MSPCHHHHTGNRTIIFHLPFRLVSCCSLAAPRSQSVRGWQVRLAKFLSDRGTKGEFQLLPLLFLVPQSADALMQKVFTITRRVSLNSPIASWMLESLFAWCFSWTEKINFFINSRQRTSRFSVRLSDYFPNPAPQKRRFPSPVHDSNPASRSPLTLNSRIQAFK